MIDRYRLALLRRKGVDLRLENGRPALRKWDTLSHSTPAYDGLNRFTMAWRQHAPMRDTLVESVRSAPARAAALKAEMEPALAKPAQGARSEKDSNPGGI